MTRRLVAALAVLAAAAAAVWMIGFAGEDAPRPVEAVGIVVDVEGGLTDVTAFRIRTTEGVEIEFVPAPGTLFDGEGSLSHLRSHLATGEPVLVAYETSDGVNRAFRVGDA